MFNSFSLRAAAVGGGGGGIPGYSARDTGNGSVGTWIWKQHIEPLA